MDPRPLPLLLAVALVDGSPAPDLGRWRRAALAAESAGVDLITVEAGAADAVLVAAALAAATTRIGIVPLAPTTTTEPFHVSTAIATVDQVSGGRAGWLAQVVPAARARGTVTWPVPDDVHADGAEHIAAVRALWDSWEDGAEIRDVATARFIHRGRVHHVDVRGEFFSVRGPSITPRPPQGHPPVFVRATDAADRALARAHADVVVLPEGAQPLDPSDPDRSARPAAFLELGAGQDLAARAERAQAAGFRGVLVRTDDLDEALADVAPLLAGLAPQTADAAGRRTLRSRLGLPEAVNPFTAARA